jgi:signal transduction histidine kinase
MIRRQFGRFLLAATLVACPNLCLAQIEAPPSLGAAERVMPRILFLQERGFPASGPAFDAAFVPAMRGFPAELYLEMIEPSRLPREQHLRRVRDYLRLKYADSRFDVVVAAGVLPLMVVRQNPGLFGHPAVVSIVGPHGRLDPREGITGIEGRNGISENVALALTLLPGTRRIVVIDAPRAGGSALEDEFRRVIAERRGLSLEYLPNRPLDETVSVVAALSDGAVVHFVRQAQDTPAEADESEALSRITRASGVPVFVHLERNIGHGALGGYVWQSEADAVRLAEMAKRLASGAAIGDIPVEKSVYRPLVDWRAMKRWNIPEDRLPAGTVTLHAPVSLFQSYPHVTSGVILVLAQLALLAGMLVQLSRRRAAEAASASHADAMQQTMLRNQELARRLITAQDAERTRIARDLHDGVCQEVASVSAELAYLRQRTRTLSSDETQQTLLAMQKRTANVAEALRLLSHDLHPSVLQHIGLDAALRSHCASMERQHGLMVSYASVPGVQPQDAGTATALFRIAQEALRNAALHGHAQHAWVSLEPGDDVLIMSIVDDGVGFDVQEARSHGGLGLLSIEERARLARGQALVSSRPGRTTVRVLVPLESRDAYTPPKNIAC